MSDSVDHVSISWHQQSARVFISVKDSGVGLSNPDNLFVPFYTTNKTGSGTGLILCRQIAEQHGGYLTLQNRSDVSGCHASINLPA